MPERNVTLSVVSHGQNALVNQLLADIQRHCAARVALVLTQNIPDSIPFAVENLAFPAEILVNRERKGFGANHNAAFASCRTPYFGVVNPDIRLHADPLPALMDSLADGRAGAAGPMVRTPAGAVEDSARRFPTVASLLKKAFVENRQPDYPVDRGALEVDWIGGMFMLFRSDAYRAVGGFDEAYFLYYEDVDLCQRLASNGRTVVYEPRTEVIHDARRASRREPGLALHHFRSAVRFLSRRRRLARRDSGIAA
jgi:N-acetylglucosaminyl-diphospho-decaprenol L-rhamnosyltransferase